MTWNLPALQRLQLPNAVDTYFSELGLLDRLSMATRKTDKHGRDLLDLCKSTNMIIMNGCSSLEKAIGYFTSVDITSCSVEDYLLSSICMIDEVNIL